MDKRLISLGFRKAKQLTRKHAKTFYFASLFLPPKQKKAAYSIYALCRLSDDSVDQNRQDSASLIQIENKINKAYGSSLPEDPLLIAFRKTVNDYKIEKIYFDQLLSGMRMDLEKNRYANFSELYDYCYKVAGVVGLIMLEIFGYKNREAKECAVSLGVAMQLTNILRDIKEDYNRNRLYLPAEELKSFNLDEDCIKSEKVDKNFIDFLKFQIRRAGKYYQASNPGIKMVKTVRARLVIWLMSDIYAGILREIENNKYDVFSRRAQVNGLNKLRLLFRVLTRRKYL